MADFKPIELEDKAVFDCLFAEDPPRTSELTFTNLFMWRHCYRPVWRVWEDVVLVVLRLKGGQAFGLPPTGPGNKAEALRRFSADLTRVSLDVRIERVGQDFVDQWVDPRHYRIIEDRNNSDYVYRAEDLINLSGNKFHKKKNHVNKFAKNYAFEYRTLDRALARTCLDLQESWCELKNCAENEELFEEDRAIYEALMHFDALGFLGGAILIDARVEAFAIGEILNEDTAVIHVEKANPDIPGLYAAINQRFCQEEWSDVTYINREQDLGVEGLRKAKMSYHPDHLVDKFILEPIG